VETRPGLSLFQSARLEPIVTQGLKPWAIVFRRAAASGERRVVATVS